MSLNGVIPTLIGVLGCMAERLEKFLEEEQLVDIVVGPDAYRHLKLISEAESGQRRCIAI